MTTIAPAPTQEVAADVQNSYSHKYTYPEFAGWQGAEVLDDILQKILPLALYRTWSIFDKKQAPGNDCYLSLSAVCKKTGLCERTVRLNVHEFEARKLLEMRPGQKLLFQADGTQKKKWVMIKDFSGLYDQAHEYWLWMRSEEYIEPLREYAELLRSLDETLIERLLRFNNYRRLILDQLPGPKPQRRCAEDETEPCQEHHPTRGPALEQEDAKDAGDSRRSQKEQSNSQNNMQKIVKNISEERISRKNQGDISTGEDSNDSGGGFEDGAAKGYTKPKKSPETEQVRGTVQSNPNLTKNPKPSSPIVPETGGADQSAKRELEPGPQQKRVTKALGKSKPRPAENALISAYVREFAGILGDLNPRSSETYLLRLAEQFGLSRPGDVLACLVRAHVKTMPIKARDHDPITGKPLKMKVVNSFFRDFSATYQEWGAGYSDKRLVEDLEEDERFRQFHIDYQAKLEQAAADVSHEIEAQTQEPQQIVESREEVQEQGGKALQIVEDLGIAAPALWMNPAEAEALLKIIREKIPLFEGVSLANAVIYHRCRSLLRAGLGSVVHLEMVFVNVAGVRFLFLLDFADEEQWEAYCKEQLRGSSV